LVGCASAAANRAEKSNLTGGGRALAKGADHATPGRADSSEELDRRVMRTRSQLARSRWLRFNAVPVARNSAAIPDRSKVFIALPLLDTGGMVCPDKLKHVARGILDGVRSPIESP
jgi:hypothetical protein